MITTMERYTKDQLEAAITDNLKRGLTLIKQWDKPILRTDGTVKRYKYFAQMATETEDAR